MKWMMKISVTMLLPLFLLASSAAFGQDLPPGPTTVHRSTLPGITMEGEFEVINLILDFAPGAATPLHTHGGPGIVTVLDGELVFAAEGKPEQLAKAGDVYLDLPGTHHTAVNKSATTARVSYFVLLPKGATLTMVTGAGQGGELPPGPTTVYRATLPGITMPGEFEMINLILDFAPNAATPAHTHGGPGIVTVLDGELVFGVPGRPDQNAQPGGVFLDLPGTVHTAVNKTTRPARVSYAVLLPKGAGLTTAVQQPTTEQGGPVGMPRTGAPLMPTPFVLALILVLLGIGFVGLAHRAAARKR
jgi:quercetin dioxygenase-like cupin family protein